jgi:hypothetical protein
MSISETLEMPFLSGFRNRQKGILQDQSNCGFFGFESSFQNCFWYVFSTFGLSQICKIRNVWMSSPFSRNTLIPCSEKISWSLKISFWSFLLPCKSLNFMVLGYPSKESQNHRNLYV